MELRKSKQTQRENIAESRIITPELLGLLRKGDHAAFKTVYIHYYAPIESFLFRLLRSHDEAEEICQNVFLVLWERRAELDPSRNIKTLLYTIAKNAVMNLFKHQKVLQKYHQQHTHDDLDSLTGEDILIAQEKELLAEITVRNMPPMRRRIFEMSRYENMSNDAIAQELGMSKENVANHLSQARKDIKKVLSILLFVCMP